MSEKQETTKSELILKGNLLSETIFKINKKVDFQEWNKDNEIEIEVGTTFGVSEEKPTNGKLVLEIEIFKEDFIIQEKPFHCLVEMEFYFEDSIEEYYDNENVVSKYALNMLSIAYPYIRAYISTLSAISGIEQIHLPAINVYDTFKKQL
ncbi:MULTISPECIES: protein-export chaperone SecB [Enterococcus]|uniref:protein-export chaperone SecB n=1 Tax=Enterococcus TaxID=1350 RepID=UPI0001E1A374|nr:protein-export chaperone SecB [Enterococcus faecalis]AQL54671.1 hypothetical protein BZG32_13560 [Enterococcus faecalis]AYZ07091.1 hypothetical protein EGX75_07565 [Enterococcus faecalis]EFM73240.1 hypothetical protein HMPREF9515_01700 [Enterococcus faecalis TX0860]EGO2509447.1 hypothetical protein [Enterococcus faecalis]EGO7946674.1 hypothetical protein [Enterococcus faecalis]